jgi:hypothetical protein
MSISFSKVWPWGYMSFGLSSSTPFVVSDSIPNMERGKKPFAPFVGVTG